MTGTAMLMFGLSAVLIWGGLAVSLAIALRRKS
ncbi:methionine/alanine import family NSS transporter small subunit [Ammoniphilus sp. YIM 78166]|nr:methionine/alanine import family NSS transporter small subunit [Ammoniphilus sp. YIM 78166]